MRTVSLFAGCGGLSTGFHKAGFDIVAAFDNWEVALNVYKKNFPETETYLCDLSFKNEDYTLIKQFNPEVIIAGPPCQDYSHAGPRNEELGRADLTVAYAKIVKTLRPEWFVMENVDRIIKSKRLGIARELLKDSGYGITERILDASFCGVPQIRKRYFMIGKKDVADGFLNGYLDKSLANKRLTVREYLGNKLEIEHYYRHPRNYSRRAVFSIDEPSPTIRGVNRPIPKNYKRHPGDSAPISENVRPLTTIERSYIQTFPEDYIFEASKSDLEQMIGNAVPVKLAEYVARSIEAYIDEEIPKRYLIGDYQPSLF